jgi:hypothetical protein
MWDSQHSDHTTGWMVITAEIFLFISEYKAEMLMQTRLQEPLSLILHSSFEALRHATYVQALRNSNSMANNFSCNH